MNILKYCAPQEVVSPSAPPGRTVETLEEYSDNAEKRRAEEADICTLTRETDMTWWNRSNLRRLPNGDLLFEPTEENEE